MVLNVIIVLYLIKMAWDERGWAKLKWTLPYLAHIVFRVSFKGLNAAEMAG